MSNDPHQQQAEVALKRERGTEDEFVGRSGLAARLGVTERTVDRMVQRGELPQPCLSPGGRPRWLWSHVVAFLKRRHVTQDAVTERVRATTARPDCG